MTTESLPKAADAEYLTEALRRSGVLDDGRVRSVTVDSTRTMLMSRVLRLRLAYDGAAAGAPSTVIVKTEHPERAGGPGARNEVAFYQRVAAPMRVPLAPICYDAACDAEARHWHLVLEDLAESHVVASAWPLPPSVDRCERIVDAHARFSAAWWDDPRLGVSVGSWSSVSDTDRQLKTLAERFARVADRLGDALSAERRALFERLLADGPRLSARYHSHRDVTIVQGDAHVWNAFLPRDGGGDVRLFDWDSWRIDVATDDLAYMIAMHWYPDLRRRLEAPLLDRFHRTLVEHGVRGYDRRALDDDYRLSVLWHITAPVWQATIDIPPVIWWNHLERIFLAVDDLGCRELLS